MVTVYIGLGSNLDHPQQHIFQALRDLAGIKDARLIRTSSLYRSSPMGPVEQPDYVNAVAEIATSLSPDSLLEALHQIETAHGRVRSDIRWGARTLDLDILLYGEEVINTKSLTIPHSGLYERAFVLYPLKEIAADDLEIPGQGKLSELLKHCKRGDLKLINESAQQHNNDKLT